MVWTTVFLVLMLVAFIPIVTAEQKISNAGDTTNPRSYLIELPELDMTGMYTDIEMIEIDPEITNSTTDWILLAHDDSGKKYLIEDIDSSDLSAAEKINTKNAVRKLWAT